MSEINPKILGLNEFELAMLDEFCAANQAKTPQEQGVLDQATAELRDQLKNMGLTIETDEQFYVACIVSIATAVNMRKLTQKGLPAETAERVTGMTIAGLRPDSSR